MTDTTDDEPDSPATTEPTASTDADDDTGTVDSGAGPADGTDTDTVTDRLTGAVDDARVGEYVERARALVDRGDTPALVGATLGFDGLVYAASRYAPEYLGVLGGSPLVIGLFGSLAMATGPVARAVGAGPDRTDSVAAPLLGAFGLLCWLLAPALALATGVPATLCVLVGVVPLTATAAGRDRAPLAPHTDGFAVGPGPDDWRGTLGAVAAVALVVLVLLVSSTLGIALGVVLALGAALGVAVAVLRYLSRSDTDVEQVVGPLGGADVPNSAVPDTSSLPLSDEPSLPSGSLPRVTPFVRALRAVPFQGRSLLLGETLLHTAVGLVSVFVVLVVTSVVGLRTTLLGVRLSPSATFGALVVVELAVGGLAGAAARRLTSVRDAADTMAVAAAAAAAFPLLFVAVPPVPAVAALLFGVFGLRAAGAAVRDGRLVAVLDETPVSAADYHSARALVVAPAPLVGGLLFALDPTVAFGVATALGSVGAWECWQFARHTDGTV